MDSITGPIVEWATSLIGDWGLWAVFLLMLLESACIPVPSEAIMLFAGFAVTKGDMSLWGAVTAGVVGNVIGSWVAYWAGLYGGRPFVDRWGKYVLLSHHKLDIAERWFARYGAVAVFFSRVLPIVRTFISLPAGMARMPFWKFTVYTTVGCVPWVLMLGWVGKAVGENWEVIEGYMKYFDYLVAACLLALLVWLVVRRVRRRSRPADAGVAQEAEKQ